MAVTAGSAFLLLIGLVVLYKKLIPISSQIHNIDVVNATSKLPVLDNDNNTSGDRCALCVLQKFFCLCFIRGSGSELRNVK